MVISMLLASVTSAYKVINNYFYLHSIFQNVVDLQQHNLAHYLDIPDNEAGRIQDKCQQYLDELQDSSEAMDLLRLFKNKDANLVSGSQPSCDDRYKEEHASYQNEPENKRSKY